MSDFALGHDVMEGWPHLSPVALEGRIDAAIAAAEKRGAEARDREWQAAVHDYAPVGVVFTPRTSAPEEMIAAMVRGTERNARQEIASKVRERLAEIETVPSAALEACSLRWVINLLEG